MTTGTGAPTTPDNTAQTAAANRAAAPARPAEARATYQTDAQAAEVRVAAEVKAAMLARVNEAKKAYEELSIREAEQKPVQGQAAVAEGSDQSVVVLAAKPNADREAIVKDFWDKRATALINAGEEAIKAELGDENYAEYKNAADALIAAEGINVPPDTDRSNQIKAEVLAKKLGEKAKQPTEGFAMACEVAYLEYMDKEGIDEVELGKRLEGKVNGIDGDELKADIIKRGFERKDEQVETLKQERDYRVTAVAKSQTPEARTSRHNVEQGMKLVQKEAPAEFAAAQLSAGKEAELKKVRDEGLVTQNEDTFQTNYRKAQDNAVKASADLQALKNGKGASSEALAMAEKAQIEANARLNLYKIAEAIRKEAGNPKDADFGEKADKILNKKIDYAINEHSGNVNKVVSALQEKNINTQTNPELIDFFAFLSSAKGSKYENNGLAERPNTWKIPTLKEFLAIKVKAWVKKRKGDTELIGQILMMIVLGDVVEGGTSLGSNSTP